MGSFGSQTFQQTVHYFCRQAYAAMKMKVKVGSSCVRALCDPIGYAIHIILRLEYWEGGHAPFSKVYQPRDPTQVSCIAGDSLAAETYMEAPRLL